MEDLLEELLNVLSEPSNRQARSTTSPTKHLATNNAANSPSANQKAQLNGSSSSAGADQRAQNSTSAEDRFKLMTIASLAKAASDPWQHVFLFALEPTEIAKRIAMFDAGIAVPNFIGYQAFYIQSKQTANRDRLEDSETTTDEQIAQAIASTSQQTKDAPIDTPNNTENLALAEDIALAEDDLIEDALAEDDLAEGEAIDSTETTSSTEDTSSIKNLASAESANVLEEQKAVAQHSETADERNATAIEKSAIKQVDDLDRLSVAPSDEFAESEMDIAEIDESVMSAFDIGDFEADTYAAQTDISNHQNHAHNQINGDEARVETSNDLYRTTGKEGSEEMPDEMSDEMLEEWAKRAVSSDLETSGLEASNSEDNDLEDNDLEDSDLEDSDLEIDRIDRSDRNLDRKDKLNQLDLESEDTTALTDDEVYQISDDNLGNHLNSALESDEPSLADIADIAPDEIAASEQPTGFISRWLRRWIQPASASIEDDVDDSNKPKLFASDQGEQANFSDRDRQLEGSELDPDLLPAESSEPESSEPEASQIDELQVELESFLEAVASNTNTSDTNTSDTNRGEPSHTNISDLSDEFDRESDVDYALPAEQEQPIEQASNATADDTAERDLHSTATPVDEELVALPVAETLFHPEEEERLDTHLETEETDIAAYADDIDDIEEDALLPPLGEKDWLSAEENANEALHASAADGDLSGVWAALEANASVNRLGPSWRTALSVAAEAGHLPVVKMLLEMCADPNQADLANGSPVSYPLMVAAASETAAPVRDELLQLLLASGAEVNQANVMGQTALMGAAEQGHIDAMQRLLEANANADLQDLLGQTAIAKARQHEQPEAIALIQQASVEKEQAIALLKAITRGDLEEVRQWIAAGLSANTRVARMSALALAAAKGEVEIARFLIEAGADINYQFRPTDPTPLFHAAYRGQLEVVSLLLEAGASTHLAPNAPIGALDYAEIGQRRFGDTAAFTPVIELLATLALRPSR